MKRTKSNFNSGDYSLAHVLYQKLGNDWYAFTEVDGECFLSKVDAAHAEAKNAEAQQDDRGPRKRRAA